VIAMKNHVRCGHSAFVKGSNHGDCLLYRNYSEGAPCVISVLWTPLKWNSLRVALDEVVPSSVSEFAHLQIGIQNHPKSGSPNRDSQALSNISGMSAWVSDPAHLHSRNTGIATHSQSKSVFLQYKDNNPLNLYSDVFAATTEHGRIPMELAGRIRKAAILPRSEI